MLPIIQQLLKLKRKYLIMIMANMLLHKNWISWRQIILEQDQNKQIRLAKMILLIL